MQLITSIAEATFMALRKQLPQENYLAFVLIGREDQFVTKTANPPRPVRRLPWPLSWIGEALLFMGVIKPLPRLPTTSPSEAADQIAVQQVRRKVNTTLTQHDDLWRRDTSYRGMGQQQHPLAWVTDEDILTTVQAVRGMIIRGHQAGRVLFIEAHTPEAAVRNFLQHHGLEERFSQAWKLKAIAPHRRD